MNSKKSVSSSWVDVNCEMKFAAYGAMYVVTNATTTRSRIFKELVARAEIKNDSVLVRRVQALCKKMEVAFPKDLNETIHIPARTEGFIADDGTIKVRGVVEDMNFTYLLEKAVGDLNVPYVEEHESMSMAFGYQCDAIDGKFRMIDVFNKQVSPKIHFKNSKAYLSFKEEYTWNSGHGGYVTDYRRHKNCKIDTKYGNVIRAAMAVAKLSID